MMKKILLALALVSATSLFAANNYSNWFTATPTAAEPTWVWSGEDGSIITNTADTAYWEIDADVTKAATEDATLFTPTAAAPKNNTVTVIDIQTTFDAMYDMSINDHGDYTGEDLPQDPPQGSLGALIVGSTTNENEEVVSSNFYAYVGSTWVPLYGAEVPASLTGDVVNVRIELLYMGTASAGVNKLRYSIGSGTDPMTFTSLTNAAGVSLFDFTPNSTKQLASVQFSGCGKVHGIAADVRTSENFDGGTGVGDDPFLIASADTFLELGVEGKFGGNQWVRLEDNFSLKGWAPIAPTDAVLMNVLGNNKTLTVDLAGNSFFGKLQHCTIQDLTINATNSSDNEIPVAVFASECNDGVTFKNCTAAGHLYNVAESEPVLAGFVLDVTQAGGEEASVTFENCTVTAELDNGTSDDPGTEDVNEKTYNGCYAFVAQISKGNVTATADTTLATVNKYEAYGTIATEAQEVEEEEVEEEGTVDVALGSVPKAFNFYTNGVAANANNIYYVEPKLSPMNAESIPTYWIAKENADKFVFAEQGKLRFEYNGQKFTEEEAPYDVAKCVTTSDEYVTEGDMGFGETAENAWCVFVNPCIAVVNGWEEGNEGGDPDVTVKCSCMCDDENTVYNRYSVASYQVPYGCSTSQIELMTDVTINENQQLELGSSGCSVTLNTSTCKITLAAGDNSDDPEMATGLILNGATLKISDFDELDVNKTAAHVDFFAGKVYIGETLWLDSEPSSEESEDEGGETPAATPTPAFARLASGASITVTNVGDTHKDFLFDATGVDEGNSCATIFSFDAAGGNDTYTLADGAVVTTAATIEPATALAKLQAADTTKCIASASTEYAYTTADALVEIVGKKGFASLADALLFAEDADVINLLGAVTLASSATINKAITLALGDYSLTIGTDASLIIDAAVTITKGSGSISGNILVKAGENKSLTWDGIDPRELTGVTFTGSETGAIFIGDKTYIWNGSAWAEKTYEICQIVVDAETTNKYETLKAAIDAATSGQTVQLIADFTDEVGTYANNKGLYEIAADKDFTIDLNGKTITVDKTTGGNGVWMEISAGAKVNFMDSSEGGKITFEGGEGLADEWTAFAYLIENRGKLTISGGTYEMNLTGKWIGYIVQESGHTANVDVELNLLGGVLNQKGTSAAVRFYNNSATKGINHTFTINGGVIQAGGISLTHDDGPNAAVINMLSGEVNGRISTERVTDDLTFNIKGGTCNFSTVDIASDCKNTKPFINITGGNVKVDACTVAAGNDAFEITGGTFTSVEATDETLKSFVPAVVCSITENETDPATYTVAKVPVSLSVVEGEHVQSVVYTINGQTVDVNPTVCYGDIVEIGAVTYEYGYGPGESTVKEGDKIVMDRSRMVNSTVEPHTLVESVTITVDAVPRTFFGGGDGSEATPYIINAAQHLVDLKDWVAAGNDSTGKYFKQETDIDMAGIAWPGIGAGAAGKRFSGVYDGGNHTIRNMTLAKFSAEEKAGATFYNYNRGLFNATDGATIMNLIVETQGFEADATNIGGGTLIGYVLGGTMISNVTTKGTLVSDYTSGGMVGALGEATQLAVDGMDLTFVDCVNEVNVTTTKDKIGGFLAYAGYTSKTGVEFIRCTNKGTVAATPASGEGNGGAAEFIGWADNSANQTFTDCVAQGLVSSTDNTTKVGTFIGRKDAGKVTTATGTNVASASLPAIGTADATMVANLSFATVDNGVATFVADDVFLSEINATAPTYKMMASGGTAMLEAGTWKFDVSLFDADALKVATIAVNDTPTKSEPVMNIVTVTVTPLSAAQGVFPVNVAGKSGNIKITDGDVKNVPGYETKSLADITDVAAFQTALNATDSAGVPLWQKLVLGLKPDQKPTVKATQDAATDEVTFTLGTLKSAEQIRATGAKIKFYVDDLLGGELKEVGDTLTLPIASLFQEGKKVGRIKVKVVVDQANQKPQAANDNN